MAGRGAASCLRTARINSPLISLRCCQRASGRSNRGLHARDGSLPPRERAAAGQTSAAAGARHGLDGEAGECQLLGSWLDFGTWRLRTFPGTRESEMGEDPLNDGRVLDRDDELHPPGASRTTQDVQVESEYLG